MSSMRSAQKGKGLKLSRRATLTPASPMRKFLPLILDAEKKGVHVLKLNVGDPDLLPPPEFLREVKKYKGPHVPYAPSPGIRVHVDAWLSYYKSLGFNLKPNQLIPTVGCAEAIMYALMAVTDPGDDVLIFEPFYPSYKSYGMMIGIKLRPVTLNIENNYALPSKREIEKHIGPRTKAIVLINPGNPTGTVMSEKEMRLIAEIAKKRNLFVISDETYRDIIFKGKPGSVLSLKNIRDRSIIIDSASKRFSLPGARIGCLISFNEEVMSGVLRFCMARLSAGTLEQHGLIPLLKKPHAYMRKITAEYKRRHEAVVKELKKIPGVEVTPAAGAFYLTVKLPIDDSDAFTAFLLRDFRHNGKTVAVAPMTGFYASKGYGKNAIRLAYVLAVPKLREAVGLLSMGLSAYTKRRHLS